MCSARTCACQLRLRPPLQPRPVRVLQPVQRPEALPARPVACRRRRGVPQHRCGRARSVAHHHLEASARNGGQGLEEGGGRGGVRVQSRPWWAPTHMVMWAGLASACTRPCICCRWPAMWLACLHGSSPPGVGAGSTAGPRARAGCFQIRRTLGAVSCQLLEPEALEEARGPRLHRPRPQRRCAATLA